MTTLQKASVTTKRTYGKTNLNKTETTTEHSHLLEHTEQTQQQEFTQTNQQKHLLQQQTSQNTHTESNRLQQTIRKHCKTCYQNNKQESRQTDKETTLRTYPHLQSPDNKSHQRHQKQQHNWT